MRSLLFLFSLQILLSSYSVVEDLSTLTIMTPSLAERQTKKLRLDNDLEVYLISDPGTHQSGAALAVEVGSFDDPEDRPGMAHFVEHMLFMGTQKYPEEEEYHRFLNEHGGKCNAFTCEDRTVYIFACNNEHFSAGLDRFSSLFISPLFRSSSLQREACAIESEFCKDVPLDVWRVLYVKKEIANPEHPFHRFCIGNKSTLTDVKSEEIKEWHEKHYSSHLMHLAIYSSEPMETLENMVVDKFSQIKRKDRSAHASDKSLFLSNTSQFLIAINPLQELKQLELSWELPLSLSEEQDGHVAELVSFVLGHEGENSLFAELKKAHLAEALYTEKEKIGKKKVFTITVKLTNQGVKEYETVIKYCFDAIDAVAKTGIPQYIYEEVRQKKKTDFAYQSREEPFSYVTEIAYSMIDEPLETYPEKTVIPTNYDPKLIGDFLNHLSPENCLITYIIDPKLIPTKLEKKERWMGTEYSLIPLADKPSLRKKSPSLVDFALPRQNPFLPEKLNLISHTQSKTLSPIIPEVISQTEKATIYCACDDRFLTPEISWIFTIKTPRIHADDPKTIVCADVFCHALEKRMNSLMYEAKLGGIDHTLSTKENGIQLKIEGYSEKAPLFLKAILSEIALFKPTEKEFLSALEFYKTEYKNKLNKTPVSLGADLLWTIIYKHHASLESKEKNLASLTYHELSTFSNHLFKESYVEGMLFGNMKQEDAKDVTFHIETLSAHPFPIKDHFKKALGALPEEKNPVFFSKKTKISSNAVILLLDCGEFSYEKKAALDILSKGLNEPFFTELRTKQQTAYLVHNWAEELEGHLYCFFLTQSSSHDTRDLISRFELFLETSLQNLSEDVISKTRFEALRASLIVALENPCENLKTMGPFLHKLAFEYGGDFTRQEKSIDGMKNLSYERFQEYAKEFIGRENHKRLGICINGKIPHLLPYRPMSSIEKIKETISYQEKKNY